MKYLWESLVFLIFVFFMAALINRREENYLADYMKYRYCRCPLEPQIPNQ